MPPRGPAQTQRHVQNNFVSNHQQSVQQSSVTASHQASHKVIEAGNPQQSNITRDSKMTAGCITRLGCDEDFAKQLNYQYVSKDLRSNNNDNNYGLPVSRSQYIPYNKNATEEEKFLQPFRPT